MPFELILADLLARTDHALGAIFLDDSGEAVELAAAGLEPFDLRVAGAHLGIYLNHTGKALLEGELGRPRLLSIEHDRLHVHVVTLPDGYFLALLVDAKGMPGPARAALREASARLERAAFEF